MTTDRVSKLHVLDGASKSQDPMLARFEQFVRDELLDLPDEDYLELIDLELAKPDEIVLGALTPFEKRCFALAQLVEQSIRDTLLEYEAAATEAMAKHIRENRVPLLSAMQHQMQHLPDEVRLDMNKRAITHTTLITSYDWSVRSRFNKWTGFLVVRKGFNVHVYG